MWFKRSHSSHLAMTWASWSLDPVERVHGKHEVVGSNPTRPTFYMESKNLSSIWIPYIYIYIIHCLLYCQVWCLQKQCIFIWPLVFYLSTLFLIKFYSFFLFLSLFSMLFFCLLLCHAIFRWLAFFLRRLFFRF